MFHLGRAYRPRHPFPDANLNFFQQPLKPLRQSS